MLNLLFSLSWISSHPVHQGYQPQRGMDHRRSHCHPHRGQLLWRPSSCVRHDARMERGKMTGAGDGTSEIVKEIQKSFRRHWQQNSWFFTEGSLFHFSLFPPNPAHNSTRNPRPDSTSAHSRCCGSHAVLQVQAVLQRCPWEICLHWWVQPLPPSFALFLQAVPMPKFPLHPFLLSLSGWSPQPQVQELLMD